MDTKELKIIHAAIQSFATHGYHATSIQDIADACGIAKGTIYKYFPSKEALFESVFIYHSESIVKQIQELTADPHLSPKQKLITQIHFQIKGYLERKDFNFIFFKEIPIKDKRKIKKVMRKTKAQIMLREQELLCAHYGDQIKPYVWDMVIALQGMVKEHLMIATEAKAPIHPEVIADIIVKRMDIIIFALKDHTDTPLMAESAIQDFLGIVSATQARDDQIKQILKEIEVKLCEISQPKLYQSYTLLLEEIALEEPRLFLIDALLSYLEKEPALQALIPKIKKLLL
ncbi:TetR/AcrR family transcriptional regulator [Hazenella sp. IB182353]|uniref:TetR family transcriptional regulator n=1 Tax=Polycladospora coralii TaxID=2771432 RepID=UPI001746E534|nr:TetR/AcrR family transcriptional regulator [Polycladospora coralii]